MNLYHYIEYKNNNSKIVFVTEAINITDADSKAKSAGFDPLRLSCSIGLKLVLFKNCEVVRLTKEEVIHVKAKVNEQGDVVEQEKFYRNFPQNYYKIDKIEMRGNSKSEIVATNEKMIKLWMYGICPLQWVVPGGATCYATDIKTILQSIEDQRKPMKVT